MTQLVINVEQPSILPSLKKVLSLMEGVSIAKPIRRARKACAKKADPTEMTKEEFYAMIDHRIADAEQDRREGRLMTMDENETGEQFLNRLLCI